MSSSLPALLTIAREYSSLDGGKALLRAFEALEAERPGLGWLALWKVASEDPNPESARTLAYALARSTEDQPISEATRLWFLTGWSGKDLSTLVNILTDLEKAIDGGPEQFPSACRSSLASFLIERCLKSQEKLVQHSVLDLAEVVSAAGAFAEFLDRESGPQLAEALESLFGHSKEMDDAELVSEICRQLRDTLPATTPTDSRYLHELADQVASLCANLADRIGETRALVDTVRERAIADQAIETEKGGGKTATKPDFSKLAQTAVLRDRYKKQIDRVRGEGNQIDCIEDAVNGVLQNLQIAPKGSLVVYGEPQSGKTEMMICLTARLLDDGHKTIVHLMNDSVDLLLQNVDRFRLAGLAPAPRIVTDLKNAPLVKGHESLLFCKKNSKDLEKLIDALSGAGPVIVVDDEADFATPNARVNTKEKTRINELVSNLLGETGKYIGVTATPARLNLNNTFGNTAETWVHFRSHDAYTGQDHFFPLTGPHPYKLTLLDGPGAASDAHKALARFLTTVAFLNISAAKAGEPEKNYSFLVHTSGKTEDHKIDRQVIEEAMTALVDGSGNNFEKFAEVIFEQASTLYSVDRAQEITNYVVANATRKSFVVLNSKRDRATAGEKPTVPTCPFTVIIGGNIVSRGVTFPNLLSMFFTRDVKSKLQQDTYIQRARMFGARGAYLKHFELTIPKRLYGDWHRCFVFHRLALQTINKDKLSPVWIGDPRISIAASSSIDRGTVDLDKGEMSFQMFEAKDIQKLDGIVAQDPRAISTVENLATEVGDPLPKFLIEYLRNALAGAPSSLAIHSASSIAGYSDKNDVDTVSRTKGFIGKPQLEESKFPSAIHHLKIFFNDAEKARVFYKNLGGVQFVQNQLTLPTANGNKK